ncbi:MAG: hypothetical protein K2N74_05020 [Clostridiales bacterium]|nr:hypothetical protein [Clostridiales bacterium]
MRSGEDWSTCTREEAETAIGYRFRDEKILKRCFTHSSYSNLTGEESNERLEFLGDSVLQLFVTHLLFERNPHKQEGDLTEQRQKYVSQEALTSSEKKAGLMRFLRYSGGEDNVGGKTPSNLFEAVIAGIYLDGGYDSAKQFMGKFLTETDTVNYKNKLQELVQPIAHETPVYTGAEKEGKYTCTVTALGKSAEAVGENKKAAEKEAAKKLYQILSARERS